MWLTQTETSAVRGLTDLFCNPRYNVTFPYKATCLFPATASCQAAGGGTDCEPCNWQIFWGVQTYSDMHRFAPVIAAIDELGIRDNTYIVFSTDNGAQGERWTSNNGGSGPNGDTSGAFTNAVGTQGPFRGCKASLCEYCQQWSVTTLSSDADRCCQQTMAVTECPSSSPGREFPKGESTTP